MKKILILLAILCLSSCSVDYTLTYDGKKFTENASGKLTTIDFDGPFGSYEEFKNGVFYSDLDQNNQYINESIQNGEDITLNIHSKTVPFLKSDRLNTCFNSKTISEDNDNFYYQSNTDFNCLYNIDNLTINLKTNTKVLKHNADKVELGNEYNTYIWKYTKENYQKSIMFIMEKNSNNSKTYFDDFGIWHLVVFILLIITLFLITFIIKKLKSLH